MPCCRRHRRWASLLAQALAHSRAPLLSPPRWQAALAALHGGRLVCLVPSAPGGARLDAARTINLQSARESAAFLPRMRAEVAAAAKELEAWVARQQTGLDLAGSGGEMSTEKLLRVGARGAGWLCICVQCKAC